MRRWLDPVWYRHLWYRMSSDLRVGIIVVTLAALGVGGFAAVTAIHENSSTHVALLTTSQRTVHVRERGRIVVKRIYERPVTVEQTRTIRTSGGTEIVPQTVVRYKPLYRPKMLTVRNVVTVTQPTTVTQPVTVIGPGRTDTVIVTQTVTVPTPAITVVMTLITVTVTTP
jgi:hypothetical protein